MRISIRCHFFGHLRRMRPALSARPGKRILQRGLACKFRDDVGRDADEQVADFVQANLATVIPADFKYKGVLKPQTADDATSIRMLWSGPKNIWIIVHSAVLTGNNPRFLDFQVQHVVCGKASACRPNLPE